MIDISMKTKTLRMATAKATLKLKPETIQLLKENKLPKGDPLPVAKVAAIQAAKNTSSIIPYCHTLMLDFVDVNYEIGESKIDITITIKAIHKTGVEMEALTAVSVCALTLYDMMKVVDGTMEITSITLLSKKGGKSDFREQPDMQIKGAVIVTSDSAATGEKEDLSGKLIVERLKSEGIEVIDYRIIPDDLDQMKTLLIVYSDEKKADLVITTGGTGLGLRDVAPEATQQIIEKEIPGITETLRAYGQERIPYSMLSRGVAGVRGNTVIINLPGSKNAVIESLNVLFPAILHSFEMLRGGGHDK
ncbi:MAG: bifunctional molybdenum cofactor biosynthesis protein MoaC/MoaB [Actinobacteria bacterium]|nr:bifunctional molybdenum cofactor biosynthesis protein MoaC/MoaB [Actinomycetota bacterium]